MAFLLRDIMRCCLCYFFVKVGNIINMKKMKVRKIITLLVILIILSNILNVLAVNVIYLLKKSKIDSVKTPIGIYGFYDPAPYINQVIEYDELVPTQRLFISKDKYYEIDNDKEYLSLLLKLNLTSILLPRTTKFFYTNWDDNGSHSQAGLLVIGNKEISYTILVKSGVNVFTLKPETKFVVFINFIRSK